MQQYQEIVQLWKVNHIPVGQGHDPDGEDLVPLIRADGWIVQYHSEWVGDEVRDWFKVLSPATDYSPEIERIEISEVFLHYFPDRDQAMKSFILQRVNSRLQGMQAVFGQAIVELRAEIAGVLEMSGGFNGEKR